LEVEQQKTPTPESVTASGRYNELEPTRTPVLQRARECSALTIPGLMPPEGTSDASRLPVPYQSISADGVNNLSAKLLLSMFPPGQGFFRLTVDDMEMEKLKQQNGDSGEDARATIEAALAKVERSVVSRLESKGNRAVNHEAFQHLIVCGNILIHVQPDGKEKAFPLDKYAVKRDLDGNVLDIVVKESLARMALPPEVQKILMDQVPSAPESDKEKNVDLYTWIQRQDDGSYKVHQEVEGSTVPGTEGHYPKGRLPWLALRWRAVAGQDYGRSRVDEYLGDVNSAEALSKAIVQFAVQAAKIVWLVKPGSTTDKNKLAKAPTGAVLEGDENDVTGLMLDKGQDFQIAKAVLDETKRRLERAFLSASAVQRDAERVTAEEIRAMIGELEQGLGGVYATLAEEYQRPLADVLLHQMMKSGTIPNLPDIVNPQIVTGLDGLSRQSDSQKLTRLFTLVGQVFGPEVLDEWVDVGSAITRLGAAEGVDTKGVVKSSDEVMQARQQKMQADAVNKLGPSAIKVAGDTLQSQQGQGAESGQ